MAARGIDGAAVVQNQRDHCLSGPTPPALELVDIAMTYCDGTQALSAISLDIAPGEFVSIVGPSGCGKSTLLRVAAGLETPSAGQLLTASQSMAYVFQDATLLPWRTCLQNAELLLELQGVPPNERRDRASEHLALVGLQGFESHYPKQLSGGMKMRVSLARSLALHPQILLFDEPFASLDEITRQRLIQELAHLHEARGFTALLVTHSVAEAIYLSDRVAVMSHRPGRIARIFDVPLQRPRRPEQRFTSDFTAVNRAVSETLQAVV